MPETNVELARRGFEAAARGDLDVIRDLLAPDVRWHGGDPASSGACRDRSEALDFMRQARLRRPGLGELVEVIGRGDKVVVILRPASQQGEPTGPE